MAYVAGAIAASAALLWVLVAIPRSPNEPRPAPTAGLADTSWFSAVVRFHDEATIAGLEIDAGAPFLDQSLHTFIELPRSDPALSHGAEPFAIGATSEGVWVALFDGFRSEIRFLPMDGSPERTVFTADAVIHAAALDPVADVVFATLLDPRTRQHEGVVSITLDEGLIELVLPPRAGEGGLDPDGTHAGWFQSMHLTPDASHLVIETCDPRCKVDVLNLASRAMTQLDTMYFPGALVGLTNELVIFRADCDQPPCPLQAASLVDGRSTQIVDGAGTAAVASLGGQSVVVYEDADAAADVRALTVRVIDSGDARILDAHVDAGMALTASSATYAVNLPAGYVAFSPDGVLASGTVVIVDLRTGARVSDRTVTPSSPPNEP
jgi:hypothetical protein